MFPRERERDRKSVFFKWPDVSNRLWERRSNCRRVSFFKITTLVHTDIISFSSCFPLYPYSSNVQLVCLIVSVGVFLSSSVKLRLLTFFFPFDIHSGPQTARTRPASQGGSATNQGEVRGRLARDQLIQPQVHGGHARSVWQVPANGGPATHFLQRSSIQYSQRIEYQSGSNVSLTFFFILFIANGARRLKEIVWDRQFMYHGQHGSQFNCRSQSIIDSAQASGYVWPMWYKQRPATSPFSYRYWKTMIAVLAVFFVCVFVRADWLLWSSNGWHVLLGYRKSTKNYTTQSTTPTTTRTSSGGHLITESTWAWTGHSLRYPAPFSLLAVLFVFVVLFE